MPKRKKKHRGKVGLTLMLVGVLIMLIGAGTELIHLSSVSLSPEGIQINGIKPIDAALIGIGALIFLSGVALYAKGK